MRSSLIKFLMISFILLMLLCISTLSFAKEEPQSKDRMIRIYAGYNHYWMNEFNEKLELENNNIINGGKNIGIEFSPMKVKVPLIGEVIIPICFEYLEAVSKTTHTAPEGSATVKWNLPIFGLYVAPFITPVKKWQFFYIRPVGAGIYSLGKIQNACLYVTDRPGRLDVKSYTAGWFSSGGLKISFEENTSVLLEAGYRWLKFTDISVIPKDGFTEVLGGALVKPGIMKESLDYSGYFLRIGVEIKF